MGHVGGDDFVVMAEDHKGRETYDPVVQQFEEEVASFYNSEDRKKGYILSANRQGEMERFPLMTLTVAVCDNQICKFEDVFDLTEALAEKKKALKQEKQKNSI